MEEPDSMEETQMETGAENFDPAVLNELLNSYVHRIEQLEDEDKYSSSDEETSYYEKNVVRYIR